MQVKSNQPKVITVVRYLLDSHPISYVNRPGSYWSFPTAAFQYEPGGDEPLLRSCSPLGFLGKRYGVPTFGQERSQCTCSTVNDLIPHQLFPYQLLRSTVMNVLGCVSMMKTSVYNQ